MVNKEAVGSMVFHLFHNIPPQQHKECDNNKVKKMLFYLELTHVNLKNSFYSGCVWMIIEKSYATKMKLKFQRGCNHGQTRQTSFELVGSV